MIISTPNHEEITDFKSLHILIEILQDEVMSPEEVSNPIEQNGPPQTGYREDLSRGQSSNPRPRSMAIQDLLNPAGQEWSESPSSSCASPRTVILGRANSIPSTVRLYSRRTSLSPPTNGRRRRTVSMSSASRTRERRAFRPTYSDEEVYFIWYHRIDLGYDWQDINHAYNAQFPERPREGFGGIQCKYYRYCEEFGVPKVRNRNRAASAVNEYGMRSRTGLTYPWMRK
jgi:hypothetical protein